MIEGAAILLAGIVIGRFIRWKKGGKNVPKTVATCACGHPRSMHVDGKGKCLDTRYKRATFDTSGKHEACPCQVYEGPEPLPEYFAKELGE